MVVVQVDLFRPFVDFIKDYMSFFGIKQSIGDFYHAMIYQELEDLHNELSEFASDKRHFVDTDVWYWKHHLVADVAFDEEETGEEKDK